jgi:hypothetical protein
MNRMKQLIDNRRLKELVPYAPQHIHRRFERAIAKRTYRLKKPTVHTWYSLFLKRVACPLSGTSMTLRIGMSTHPSSRLGRFACIAISSA